MGAQERTGEGEARYFVLSGVCHKFQTMAPAEYFVAPTTTRTHVFGRRSSILCGFLRSGRCFLGYC